MNTSSMATSPLPSPLERLQASLQRSIERSGPASLYSRTLKAEIARYEAVLQSTPRMRQEPWTVRKVG